MPGLGERPPRGDQWVKVAVGEQPEQHLQVGLIPLGVPVACLGALVGEHAATASHKGRCFGEPNQAPRGEVTDGAPRTSWRAGTAGISSRFWRG